eukprot:m51a1_g10964 hypothetical protein (124) ;mRNA; f:228014-228526
MSSADFLSQSVSPALSEDSPLRVWEAKHAEELAAKSKKESERREEVLKQARKDIEDFTTERDARIAAKEKQNTEQEELFRETQEAALKEGDVWQQAGKVFDYSKKSGEKDTTRMRQLLVSLKH